jgi:hypothetical protein
LNTLFAGDSRNFDVGHTRGLAKCEIPISCFLSIGGRKKMVSPYRPEFFDGIVKNKLPGKLFFSFDPSEVPL